MTVIRLPPKLTELTAPVLIEVCIKKRLVSVLAAQLVASVAWLMMNSRRSAGRPSASRLLIRQAGVSDLGGVLRVCETHAEYWDGKLPSEIRLAQYFDRALRSQDDVFQFWVAEDGHGSMVGWEMLAATSTDPADRQLTAEATTCLGRQAAGLGRVLATHVIRHAVRTPLQYVFARVPTRYRPGRALSDMRTNSNPYVNVRFGCTPH